jgi:hypothetical protein
VTTRRSNAWGLAELTGGADVAAKAHPLPFFPSRFPGGLRCLLEAFSLKLVHSVTNGIAIRDRERDANLLAADGRGWCSNDRGDVVKKEGERGDEVDVRDLCLVYKGFSARAETQLFQPRKKLSPRYLVYSCVNGIYWNTGNIGNTDL